MILLRDEFVKLRHICGLLLAKKTLWEAERIQVGVLDIFHTRSFNLALRRALSVSCEWPSLSQTSFHCTVTENIRTHIVRLVGGVVWVGCSHRTGCFLQQGEIKSFSCKQTTIINHSTIFIWYLLKIKTTWTGADHLPTGVSWPSLPTRRYCTPPCSTRVWWLFSFIIIIIYLYPCQEFIFISWRNFFFLKSSSSLVHM